MIRVARRSLMVDPVQLQKLKLVNDTYQSLLNMSVHYPQSLQKKLTFSDKKYAGVSLSINALH